MEQHFPILPLETMCQATLLCTGELAALIPSPMPCLPPALAKEMPFVSSEARWGASSLGRLAASRKVGVEGEQRLAVVLGGGFGLWWGHTNGARSWTSVELPFR